MAESWLSVLDRSRKKKNGKEQINVIIMQPPKPRASTMYYTGAGANGVVEPGKAAMYDAKTGSVYHEGEGVIPDNGGKQIIPASQMPGMVTPGSEMGQRRLSTLRAPGFAAGGYAPNSQDEWVANKRTGETAVTTPTPAPVTPWNNQSAVSTVPPPPAIGNSLDWATGANGTIKTSTPNQEQLNRLKPENINPGTPTFEQIAQDQTISNTVPFTPARKSWSGTGAATRRNEQDPVMDLSLVKPVGVLPDQQASSITKNVIPETPKPVVKQSPYEAGALEGYSAIRDLARGQSKTNKMIEDRALLNSDANNAANNAAMIQSLRAQNMSEDDINAYMAAAQRSQSSQRAGTVRDLAINAQEQANAAQRDLTTMGRAVFENDRSFEYNKNVNAAATALAAGDYATAAKSYGAAFPGVNIDFSKLQTKEAAENFDTGMKQMAAFIESGMTDWDSIPAARKTAIIQAVGGDENTAELMFNQQVHGSNVFERQVDAFLDSYPNFKSFPPEKQAEIRDTYLRALRAKTLGELDMTEDESGMPVFTPVSLDEKGEQPPPGVNVALNQVYVAQSGQVYRKTKDGNVPVTSISQMEDFEKDQILKQVSSGPVFNEIVKSYAQDYIDGTKTDKIDTSTPAGQAIYQSIASNPGIPHGLGPKSEDGSRYKYNTLENLQSGDIIEIDGVLYKGTGTASKMGGTRTAYTLTNLASGNSVVISAGKNDTPLAVSTTSSVLKNAGEGTKTLIAGVSSEYVSGKRKDPIDLSTQFGKMLYDYIIEQQLPVKFTVANNVATPVTA